MLFWDHVMNWYILLILIRTKDSYQYLYIVECSNRYLYQYWNMHQYCYWWESEYSYQYRYWYTSEDFNQYRCGQFIPILLISILDILQIPITIQGNLSLTHTDTCLKIFTDTNTIRLIKIPKQITDTDIAYRYQWMYRFGFNFWRNSTTFYGVIAFLKAT